MTTQSTVLKDATPANTITLENADGVFSVKKGEPGVAIASFASTGNAVKGTTTNDNAAAGYVGEYIESVVTPTSTGLTTGVQKNVTSITLTAGDWDLSGMVVIVGAATTAIQYADAGISSTNAALESAVTISSLFNVVTAVVPTLNPSGCVPNRRVSIASTTTYYLVARVGFSVATAGVGGSISARRVR